MLDFLPIQLGIVFGLLAAMAMALEAGFQFGHRDSLRHTESTPGQVGAIQGAALGLLGLPPRFTSAGAASRLIERQALIAHEANAIGTASLRAEMLNEPYASQARQPHSEHVQHPKHVPKQLPAGQMPDVNTTNAELHTRMWRAASDGVRQKPAMSVVVLNSINEVIDLHSLRVYAGLKHLPLIIV